MTVPSRPSDAPVIPEDVIERAAEALNAHLSGSGDWSKATPRMAERALTVSGLPARVAELEAALDRLMRAAKAWLEPSGSYANPAMHQARAALNAKGAPDA